MFLADNFALSDAKDNTSGPWTRGNIRGLPLFHTLLAICQKSQEPSFWEVIDFCFISIWNFSIFKNPFVTIMACPNFPLDSEDLFCLCNRKKLFLGTMAAAQAAENHGDG